MVQSQPKNKYEFPAVAIGASAGGLVALEAFFKNTPADSGLAFVIVQHLSSEFKSLMDTLLARHTDMPIHIIEEGMRIKPNHIFLIPSGTLLSIKNKRFLLTETQTQKPVLRYPIDTFFKSLSADADERAIGVVLSGAGTDGSRGIVDIKNRGGIVLAQDEKSARFEAMPQAAIETGLVDYVLNPREMPTAIQTILNGQRLKSSPEESDQFEIITAENAFTYILELLQKQFKVDFSQYKIPTLLRRIDRRMQMGQFQEVELYVSYLKENSGELDSLYRDLLVDVTHFYRDKKAFQWLEEEAVLLLLQSKSPKETLRLWVAGCATGQEAYSIASLVQYLIDSNNLPLDFKLFATDLHEDSIRQAALGYYAASQRHEIPEHIFEQYFFEENGRIYIEQDIRKKIIFAAHDLLNDSPFTNLDFISCRNVLIYLQNDAQQRILQQFHFGLNKDGVLFLGPSEYLGGLVNEFEEMNRLWRVYRKSSNRRLSDITHLNLTRRNRVRSSHQITHLAAQEIWQDSLFARYVPDSILVDSHWYLIRTFGNGSKYLTLPSGRVDLLVTRLIHDELVTPLRAGLYRAAQEQMETAVERVMLKMDEQPLAIELKIIPVSSNVNNVADGAPERLEFFLIVLDNSDSIGKEFASHNERPLLIDSNEANYVGELERELLFTRESLQATIEELETTNEELQSSNEELIAANEELQSTNEELHSVNEELYTVNSEYLIQNEQLEQLNQDIKIFQETAGTIAISLTDAFQIIDFSPHCATLFGLLPHDKGRSVLNLLLFDYISNDMLQFYFEEVLTGKSIHFITIVKNNSFLIEFSPKKVEGETAVSEIVINLTDISRVVNRELIRPVPFNLKLDVDTHPIDIVHYIYDIRSQNIIFANDSFVDVLGYAPDELYQMKKGAFFNQLVHPDDHQAFNLKIADLDEGHEQTVVESTFRIKHLDGSWRWIRTKEACFGRNINNQILQIIGSGVDVTERVELQHRMKQLEAQLADAKEPKE
ncbi:MAG: chemotaxis protein CheB [Chloroflexota bacterium]